MDLSLTMGCSSERSSAATAAGPEGKRIFQVDGKDRCRNTVSAQVLRLIDQPGDQESGQLIEQSRRSVHDRAAPDPPGRKTLQERLGAPQARICASMPTGSRPSADHCRSRSDGAVPGGQPADTADRPMAIDQSSSSSSLRKAKASSSSPQLTTSWKYLNSRTISLASIVPPPFIRTA